MIGRFLEWLLLVVATAIALAIVVLAILVVVLTVSAPRPSSAAIPAALYSGSAPRLSTGPIAASDKVSEPEHAQGASGNPPTRTGAPNAADAHLAEPGSAGAPLSQAAVGGGGRFPAGLVAVPPVRPISQGVAWRAPGRATTEPAARSCPLPSARTISKVQLSGVSVAPEPMKCNSPCYVDTSYPDSGHVSTAGSLVRTGIASTYGYGYSEWWVALPDGPGWRFVACGAGGCRKLVSTDTGPAKFLQRPPFNRVVDLPVGAFEAVCGVPVSFGLCPVEVTILGRVR